MAQTQDWHNRSRKQASVVAACLRKMRGFLLFLLLMIPAVATAARKLPNIVLILCDDLGYGDLGAYGSTRNRTPHIDRMAEQGMRFTDFYSSSPVCTPARASLLTGSYAQRVGLHENETGHWVLIPRDKRGLHPDELTVAELLHKKGYATACIGKWHLGDQPPHLPTEHGFEVYYGIPYSNDMAAKHRGDPPLPLVRGTVVIEAPADQSTLTKRYTEEAVRFIEENKDRPFFLYLPHTFPHMPLFASPDFHGKSANGRYGDTVEEIDWSTGRVLDALERLGLEENTLVIFTSDNGSIGRRGASNEPLAGAKGSTMEGGMRVPMIARWPGRIPAGSVSGEVATHMDMLPTFAAIVGAELPARAIDGHDILPLLMGEEGAESPYEAFYYYRRRQLQAVRWGLWKWHLPLERTFPKWNSHEPLEEPRPGKLVHLGRDLQETTDVSEAHTDVMRKMRELADKAKATLGHEAHQGSEQRPALDLDDSVPMLHGES